MRSVALACMAAVIVAVAAAVAEESCTDEVRRLQRENAELASALQAAQSGRHLEEAGTWAEFIDGIDAPALNRQWAGLNRAQPQALALAADPTQKAGKKRAPPLARLWWRLTRFLFAAKVLPVDAAGGKHRGHRRTIIRRYVDNFVQSEEVSRTVAKLSYAVSTLRCAEVGDGHFLKMLAPCTHRYVIDIKDPAADVRMDLTAPDYGLPGVTRNHYHVIVMNEVLEHVSHARKAIRTLHELLAPGGVFIMTAPFLMAYHANPEDYHRFTPTGIRAVLTQAGFHVEVLKEYGNWLAMTGFAAGFGADEVVPALLDMPDWKERDRPYQLDIAALSRKLNTTKLDELLAPATY